MQFYILTIYNTDDKDITTGMLFTSQEAAGKKVLHYIKSIFPENKAPKLRFELRDNNSTWDCTYEHLWFILDETATIE